MNENIAVQGGVLRMIKPSSSAVAIGTVSTCEMSFITPNTPPRCLVRYIASKIVEPPMMNIVSRLINKSFLGDAFGFTN